MNKQTIGLVITMLVLVLAWVGVRTWIAKTHPDWLLPPKVAETAPPTTTTAPTSGEVTPTTDASTTAPTATSVSATGPTTGPSLTTPAGFAALPAAIDSAKPVTLGSATPDDPNFAMQLAVSPLGAGIDSITLTGFKRSEDFKKPPKERGIYVFQQPYAGFDYSRPLATRSITINGQQVDLSGVAWSLEKSGENEREVLAPEVSGGRLRRKGPSATYVATIAVNNEPAVRLTKTYTIFPRAVAEVPADQQKNVGGQGYEITVDYRVENVSAVALTVQSTINGPTLPPRESTRPPDRQLMSGYHVDNAIEVRAHAVEEFSADKRTIDLTKDKNGRAVAWAGTSTVYFNAFVMPEDPASIVKVAAEGKLLEETHLNAEDRPILLAMETASATLQPGQAQVVPLSAYFGPRWREVLQTPHYAMAPRAYDASLVIKTGPCSFCVFDSIINVLVWLLGIFHAVFRDWGLAIICLVALVRSLLHPITKRSQVQMMKMGKMGPELQKLREKYGDDKEAFAKAQMSLMKEQGMGPLLGCLPMFLQMPIWIALYSALQTTFELRHEPFLWGFTWIRDLSKPDYLVKFSHDIPLIFGLHLDGINLLPILLSIIFYVQFDIQNRLQPKGTPEQEQQKKMMKWMSTLLFPLILYYGPSGLNLYILTSTLVGIVESKVVRDHIKQKEAAEKAAGPVVVDARPTRAAKRLRDEQDDAPTAPKTGMAGWMQRMQARIEQIQREQEKKQRGKGKM